MLANAKLNNVQNNKKPNDEFYTRLYTRLGDIEKELNEYDPKAFKNKVIFCDYDDPSSKNVWRFFHMNFHRLGLKKLIAAHYAMDGSSSYALTYDSKKPQDDADFSKGTKVMLDDDFQRRRDECTSLLKQSDMVVRNLPSSLVGDYIAMLEQYTHPYSVIGDCGAIICKARLPLLKEEKTELWLFIA